MIRLTDKMGIFLAVNIINKQRKERDRSIPGSLLLHVNCFIVFELLLS